ncbi:MAG: Gfo/Idh/MocA family oxidoreductase [Lachnospiraceae bacterium]
MQKLKLGIIGVGAQGGFYTTVLTGIEVTPRPFEIKKRESDLIEVAAFCDTKEEVRTNLLEKFPGIPVFEDYMELLDSGLVDAIVTTVPHYEHTKIGIAALERGIHVLLEKPAGVYTKQVKEIIEASKRHSDLTFAVMFNQRMNPLYRKVKEIIANGEIGEIRRTNWIITDWYRTQAYYNNGAWRGTWAGEGGGVLVNQSPHQLDLIQWLTGVPATVSANVKYGYKRDVSVENEVTALLDYGNGATGVFITCTHEFNGTNRLEISGNKGRIIVDGLRKATIIRMSQTEEEINLASLNKGNNDADKLVRGVSIGKNLREEEVLEFPAEEMGQFHMEVIQNFAENIVYGTPLIAPGSDGMNGVKLANAIHLSSWLHKEVSMNFDEDLYVKLLNEKVAQELASEE